MAEGYKVACESLDFSQQAAFNAMTLLHGLHEETEVLHPSMNTSLCETLDKFLHQCDPVEKLDIGSITEAFLSNHEEKRILFRLNNPPGNMLSRKALAGFFGT